MDKDARIADLEAENARLKAIIQRYMNTYPAFRMKPIGAPGSIARIEQEKRMELEELAVAALAKEKSHE